ncbi:aminotransferase class V-fold PLP-dependent enzyme [Reyranella sp.]|uniref:aminotransferase class V-fold PLP-dependent enzyme n=1 Tax=Reyranella sp. TaxID=1929291 RepID=UPI003D13DC62
MSCRSFDPAALKREFPGLADSGLHYLDNAATAQMPETVLQALYRFEIEARANVHEGAHRRARAATVALTEARSQVARFLNAHGPDEVVFTYGTTSSLNLLARTFGASLDPGDEILLSVLEHHSNLVPWQRLASARGLVLRFLPMTPDGRIDMGRLTSELTPRCRLVAMTHCSNVTGAITDVAPLVAAARVVGAKVLLDGAQRAPHGPLDMRALGVDFYAFSGHKTYGPTGIGVLWGRRELLEALPPFLTGGQMIEEVTLTSATFRPPPRRFEAGTPPIAGAIGLGTALGWMQSLDWRAIRKHEVHLTRRLLDGLASIKGARVLGPMDTEDRRGVVTFCVDAIAPTDVCRHLDGHGVALRGGHHCAQPLVRAFGVEGAARASLGPYSLDGDVDALLNGLEELVQGRRGPKARDGKGVPR